MELIRGTAGRRCVQRWAFVRFVVVLAVHLDQRGRHLVEESPRKHGRFPAASVPGRSLRAVQILLERTAHGPNVSLGRPVGGPMVSVAPLVLMTLRSDRLVLMVLVLVMVVVLMLLPLLVLQLRRNGRHGVMVLTPAHLIVRTYQLQAGCVLQELGLVLALPAEVAHELVRSVVQLVEVVPLVQGHAASRVTPNTQ